MSNSEKTQLPSKKLGDYLRRLAADQRPGAFMTLDVSAEDARALLAGLPSETFPALPPTGNHFDAIKAAIHADPEYGWSWHCNIAMPILDARIGVTHQMANDAAANVMQHLFRFDPRQCKEWQWKESPEKAAAPQSVSMEGQPMGDPHPCDLTRTGCDPITGKPNAQKAGDGA